MADAKQKLDDMFNAYRNTSRFKDGAIMEIMLRRKEFEENLDKMWQNYTSGNLRQVVEYKKQVQIIKDAGLVVQRSKSTGKHRIVTAGRN